ncbi:hypothetical protein NDU88_008081 [Pleurodeles waltl]|uniref:Uncharacterized protein n=1 Tax=Pleurodeles waltl TaxID=8319 RepID=A0AAV7NYB2_PLEWA|nr:hypothetical protein NDU88_008081 [Pleurodeles waltl]
MAIKSSSQVLKLSLPYSRKTDLGNLCQSKRDNFRVRCRTGLEPGSERKGRLERHVGCRGDVRAGLVSLGRLRGRVACESGPPQSGRLLIVPLLCARTSATVLTTWCLTRGRVACEAVPRSGSASALEFPADGWAHRGVASPVWRSPEVAGVPGSGLLRCSAGLSATRCLLRSRVTCLAVPRSGSAFSAVRNSFPTGSLRGRVACLAVPQRAVIPPTGLPKGS